MFTFYLEGLKKPLYLINCFLLAFTYITCVFNFLLIIYNSFAWENENRVSWDLHLPHNNLQQFLFQPSQISKL